jgi:hypothetical protein
MPKQLDLSVLGARRYWSVDEGRLAVEAWRDSAMSPLAFAAKHEFDVQKLYWWRKKLNGTGAPSKFRTPTPPSALQLVPVAVLGQEREPPHMRIEIRDCVIEVCGAVDEASLRHVLAAVRAC